MIDVLDWFAAHPLYFWYVVFALWLIVGAARR